MVVGVQAQGHAKKALKSLTKQKKNWLWDIFFQNFEKKKKLKNPKFLTKNTVFTLFYTISKEKIFWNFFRKKNFLKLAKKSHFRKVEKTQKKI